MAQYSSFQVGGPAAYFCKVESKEDVQAAVHFAKEKSLPIFFLGGGSNILFSDKGFLGLVVQLSNSEIEEGAPGKFSVGAGVKNAELYTYAKQRNRDFSPFLTIPGSIGGAIAGNAGVPHAEISDYFESAEIFCISNGVFEEVGKGFFDFSYRHTIFHNKPELRSEILIWKAILSLPEKPIDEIDRAAKKAVSVRREKQPWGKTGGSFFKNPTENAAGYYLDQVGMKGKKEGGAFFSEKHANFMMNDGSGTQEDILNLARIGAQKVKEKFGVTLESEVRVLNEYGGEVSL